MYLLEAMGVVWGMRRRGWGGWGGVGVELYPRYPDPVGSVGLLDVCGGGAAVAVARHHSIWPVCALKFHATNPQYLIHHTPSGRQSLGVRGREKRPHTNHKAPPGTLGEQAEPVRSVLNFTENLHTHTLLVAAV